MQPGDKIAVEVLIIQLRVWQSQGKLSSPEVISTFYEKIYDNIDSDFTVGVSDVIDVVENWPDSCREGQNEFLSAVGIQRVGPHASGDMFIDLEVQYRDLDRIQRTVPRAFNMAMNEDEVFFNSVGLILIQRQPQRDTHWANFRFRIYDIDRFLNSFQIGHHNEVIYNGGKCAIRGDLVIANREVTSS